jgi:hypothetical protein
VPTVSSKPATTTTPISYHLFTFITIAKRFLRDFWRERERKRESKSHFGEERGAGEKK